MYVHVLKEPLSEACKNIITVNEAFYPYERICSSEVSSSVRQLIIHTYIHTYIHTCNAFQPNLLYPMKAHIHKMNMNLAILTYIHKYIHTYTVLYSCCEHFKCPDVLEILLKLPGYEMCTYRHWS